MVGSVGTSSSWRSMMRISVGDSARSLGTKVANVHAVAICDLVHFPLLFQMLERRVRKHGQASPTPKYRRPKKHPFSAV
jgi:hypothetical protein